MTKTRNFVIALVAVFALSFSITGCCMHDSSDGTDSTAVDSVVVDTLTVDSLAADTL